MEELRQLSARDMKTHPPEVTLQPTVIVGEAFVRLAKHKPEDFKDENDFRATAAVILREVFAERAKKRPDQEKRESARSDGGKDEDIGGFPGSSPELFLALEAALRELAEQDRRAARVAELRIFGSLPLSVVASIVGVTTDVAERDWRFAQAYLKKHTERRAEQA